MVQGITYSDRTDSKLWFMLLHIATGQRANCGTDYYTDILREDREQTVLIILYIAAGPTKNCGLEYYI